MKRRSFSAWLAASGALPLGGALHAQTAASEAFPNKAVRLVVPTQNPSLYASMPYDPAELVPIAKLHEIPYVLAVPESLGVSTLQAFIQWAKQPGRSNLSYGTIATSTEVLGEIIKQATGLDLARVRYRGEQPALTDLLAGHVTCAILSPGAVARQAGRLKVLAVSGHKRLPNIDAPTMLEAGIPDTGLVSWGGIFAPATVPRPVFDKLAKDVLWVGSLPEITGRTAELGFAPSVAGAREFAEFVTSEMAFWKRVTKQFNITAG